MNRFSVIGLCSTVLFALGASGCTADATGSDVGSSSAAVSESPKETVLATLQLDEGHTVTFRQVGDGIMVGEQLTMGQTPALKSATGSVLDVYRTLSKGAEPPAALTGAEAARVALAAAAPAAADVAPPPAPAKEPTAQNALRPRPMGTAWDTAFQQQYCSSANSSSCPIGSNEQLVTSWNATNEVGENSYTQNIQSFAGNNGSITSTYGFQRWNGSAWVNLWTTPLAPKQEYAAYWYYPTQNYFLAFQTSTGGDAAVDIWPFTPVTSGTIYPNQNLVSSGSYFRNDSSVTVTLTSGSLTETIGTYPVSNGNFYGTNFVTCSPYSGPGTYNVTLKATGVQTTQVATSTVSITGCYL